MACLKQLYFKQALFFNNNTIQINKLALYHADCNKKHSFQVGI